LVLRAERRLGCDIESSVQDLALRAPRLVRLLNVGYAAGNVALSVGWLILLYRRSNPDFGRERRAAVVAFVGALPLFLLLPTAPPRSQAEFVDTLAAHGLNLDSPYLVRLYNPIAALPSHHVAFAVVSGIGLSAQTEQPLARAMWMAYPAAVATVVVATANHFALDVVLGALLGAAARRITR
jgi:hypothetical protein